MARRLFKQQGVFAKVAEIEKLEEGNVAGSFGEPGCHGAIAALWRTGSRRT
jgi:hypothetical protein